MAEKPNSDIQVHSVDIRHPPRQLQKLHAGEHSFIHCDISDKDAVWKLLVQLNPRTIFHTASVVDLRQYPSPLLERVNIEGTHNILEALAQEVIEKIPRYLVYTSSIDVVSTRQGAQGADEATPTVSCPSNHYKRTKIAAEKAVLVKNMTDQLYTCAVRPGHIFGPADVLLPLSRHPIALGPASARMSFTYVENCARAHIFAALKLKEEVSSGDNSPGSAALAGSALFVNDFDTNFADTYRVLGGHGPVSVRIPVWLAVVIVFIAEMLETFFFRVFGVRIITQPVTGITNAMLESTGMHTACSRRAGGLIGYWRDPENAENVGSRVCGLSSNGLVGRVEAIRRTRMYACSGEIPDECYNSPVV